MSDVIEYKSDNGYTGRMYGKSSLSIFNANGKEIFHTGFWKGNTLTELQKQVDEFPEFLAIIGKRHSTFGL